MVAVTRNTDHIISKERLSWMRTQKATTKKGGSPMAERNIRTMSEHLHYTISESRRRLKKRGVAHGY